MRKAVGCVYRNDRRAFEHPSREAPTGKQDCRRSLRARGSPIVARRAPRARSMAYEFGKPFALYRSDARGCRGAPWGSAKQHSVASLADPPRQAEPSYRRPAPFVVTWRDDARRGLHLLHLLPRIARYQRAGAFHNASSANATRASAGPPTYYISKTLRRRSRRRTSSASRPYVTR